MNGLIDTNILIYLAGKRLQPQFLASRYKDLYVSRITQMEFLGFNFEKSTDEQAAQRLISAFNLVDVDAAITVVTIRVRKQKRIKLPDAIIYATAKELGCELVTANYRDFQGLSEGVPIFNPFST